MNLLKKLKEIHGDEYDYSKVEYIDSKTEVCIICKIHGEFFQTSVNHLRSRGCSKCGGNYSYTTEEWIKKVKEIHGDKYDYSKVNYNHSQEKISIICKIHGEFLQKPSKHLEKHGCNECGIEQIRQKQTSNTEEFIEKAY